MIYGDQIGLRAIEAEDLAQLRDWRNIPEFRRCFREVRELNMQHQQRWFNNLIDKQNDFMFMIVDKESGEAIGAAGILYINWIIRSGDFSFYIGKDESYIDNEGFARDAVKTLLKYAFHSLNLNKIWMELYQFDQLKIDFFTKEFTFQVDGRLRSNCFEDGKYWDSFMLSMLSSDYEPAAIGNL